MLYSSNIFIQKKSETEVSPFLLVSVMCYDLLVKVSNLYVSLISVVTDLVVLLAVLECV